MQYRSVRILTVLFFLGLPFAGLLLFWKDAHRKIENSAAPFARKVTEDILSNWDAQLLDDLGTLQFRQSKFESEFAQYKARYGRYKDMSDWRLVRSYAGSRDDMVWQLVNFTGHPRFEKGDATVELTVARRTMSPEWRIEAFELKPR